MKGCLIAILLLGVMLAGVAVHAVYIRRTGDMLTEGLDALPTELSPPAPDARETGDGRNRATSDAVAALSAQFEKRATILHVTVPSEKLEEIRKALLLLESYARSGAQTEYAATRRLLLELSRNFARSEDLTWENLL